MYLNHDPDPRAIHLQFMRLLQLVPQNGNAVAIGHPYPIMLDSLETVLPNLDTLGIKGRPRRDAGIGG